MIKIIITPSLHKPILCLNYDDAAGLQAIISTSSPCPAVMEETCVACVLIPQMLSDSGRLQLSAGSDWPHVSSDVTRLDCSLLSLSLSLDLSNEIKGDHKMTQR